MQKRMSKVTLGLSVIAPLLVAGYGLRAFAHEEGREWNQEPEKRQETRGNHEELRLGICVGQALSQQGIILPAQSFSSLDSTTLDAIDAAVTACRADMSGNTPQPSPSPSSTPSPSNPSPQPSPSQSTTQTPTNPTAPISTVTPGTTPTPTPTDNPLKRIASANDKWFVHSRPSAAI